MTTQTDVERERHTTNPLVEGEPSALNHDEDDNRCNDYSDFKDNI